MSEIESKFPGHIYDIIESFVSACYTEEEIHELLAELSSIDWKTALVQKAYERRLRPCGICREWKDTHTFRDILIRDGRGYSGTNYAPGCPECIEKAPFNAPCIICSKIYPSQIDLDKDFICYACFNGQELISGHNSRARKLKLPTTLTLLQWTSALRHFDNKCAYCGGKYECLEHYIPLQKNGKAGTTAMNCLPACYRCNITKGDKHPDDFVALFPVENIARIKAFFASL